MFYAKMCIKNFHNEKAGLESQLFEGSINK